MSQWELGKEKRAAFLAKSPIATCAAEIVGVQSAPSKINRTDGAYFRQMYPDRYRLRVSDAHISCASISKICTGPFAATQPSNIEALRALFKSEQKNFLDSAYSIRIGWRNIFGRHGRLLLPASYFQVFSMVLIRLGEFLYRAGWMISGLLLLDFPATIFAYSGFFPRLTNVADMIAIGFACTAVGCLSWFAGRALRYALARRARSHSPGVLPG
jgi:hypothetical protein